MGGFDCHLNNKKKDSRLLYFKKVVVVLVAHNWCCSWHCCVYRLYFCKCYGTYEIIAIPHVVRDTFRWSRAWPMRCACWRESSPCANTVIDIVGIILTTQNVMQVYDACVISSGLVLKPR